MQHYVDKTKGALSGEPDVPGDKYGQTLEEERLNAGDFGVDGVAVEWAHLRLYAGAQYTRTLKDFRCVMLSLQALLYNTPFQSV